MMFLLHLTFIKNYYISGGFEFYRRYPELCENEFLPIAATSASVVIVKMERFELVSIRQYQPAGTGTF